MGGKSYIAEWIVSHFPAHRCYVEPFGGAAWVLLAKPPSKVEIYNDINRDLVLFFKVLRDRTCEFVSKVAFTPISRALYEDLLEKWRTQGPPSDELQRAWEWFILQRQSFSGKWYAGWAHGKTRSQAQSWLSSAALLVDVADRLMDVSLECRDFREVIEDYDSPETLFYVDPPYVESDPSYYAAGVMSWKDHIDLANLLNKVQGKVVLSYYHQPLLLRYYASWRREEKLVVKHSTGITKNRRAETRPRAVELLLMNF
jgi:DNA adenine methylase